MPMIVEYPLADVVSNDDVLLVDGQGGTKIATKSTLLREINLRLKMLEILDSTKHIWCLHNVYSSDEDTAGGTINFEYEAAADPSTKVSVEFDYSEDAAVEDRPNYAGRIDLSGFTVTQETENKAVEISIYTGFSFESATLYFKSSVVNYTETPITPTWYNAEGEVVDNPVASITSHNNVYILIDEVEPTV